MEEFRLCKECRFVKPLDHFYVSNQTLCKECVKARVRNNRAEKIEYYREYDRARGKLPHRVANTTRVVARYREENAKRYRANSAVGNAVRDGRLQRHPCWVCGAKAVAHHADYDRPLDVVWLCQAHHKAAHAIAQEMEA